MSSRLCLMLVAALALGGCNNSQTDKDPAQTDSDSNPNYKQARQDLDNKNPQGAVADYQAALAANPKLPGAHYELGVIYAEQLNDPISAIYHFKRFLELSPETDKKDQVQAIIDKQGAIYADSLPHNGPTAEDMAKLQSENEALTKEVSDAKTTISELQDKLNKRSADDIAAAKAALTTPVATYGVVTNGPPPASVAADGSSTEAGVPAAGSAPAGSLRALPIDQESAASGNASADSSTNGAPVAAGAARSYTVVKGDSYWKIAKKMYPGDTKNGVAKIQEANKQTMSKPLKIGQVLVIPQ